MVWDSFFSDTPSQEEQVLHFAGSRTEGSGRRTALGSDGGREPPAGKAVPGPTTINWRLADVAGVRRGGAGMTQKSFDSEAEPW